MSARYAARRRTNAITLVLSVAATVFGLGWLVLVLGALLWQGFSGLSPSVFTQMTPPPGASGGLLNPIIGSLLLTLIAVAIGTPIGILAGTYMAEYGRYHRLSTVVRFINDILLSAPSIVIGLFIYEVMVSPMGHFSGLAGGVALAVIVMPVVVRTTEDMLTLVPNALREAATSIGLPRSMSISARLLPGGARRNGDGRAAGGRADQRRNRAAAVHLAEQPVLEHEPQRADGEPAGRHLPVCAQSLQGLAVARLDRRADHHSGGTGLEHQRPCPVPSGKQS